MKTFILSLSFVLISLCTASAREVVIEPYAVSARMIERELEPEVAPVGILYHHEVYGYPSPTGWRIAFESVSSASRPVGLQYQHGNFEIIIHDGGRYWNLLCESISHQSKEEFIQEAMEEMIAEEFPWLADGDLGYRYPFIGIRGCVNPHLKPISTDTIVDKSFKDLSSGRDSNLEIVEA